MQQPARAQLNSAVVLFHTSCDFSALNSRWAPMLGTSIEFPGSKSINKSTSLTELNFSVDLRDLRPTRTGIYGRQFNVSSIFDLQQNLRHQTSKCLIIETQQMALEFLYLALSTARSGRQSQVFSSVDTCQSWTSQTTFIVATVMSTTSCLTEGRKLILA